MKRIKVIYLIGTAYTGSTLMAMLMNIHPKIISLGEVKNLLSIGKIKATDYLCSCSEDFERCKFYNNLFNVFQSNKIQFDIKKIWPTEYRYKNKFIRKLLSNNYPNYSLLNFQFKLSSSLPSLKNRVKRIDNANYIFMKSAIEISNSDYFFDASKCMNRLNYLKNINEIELKIIRMGRDVRGYAGSAKKNLGMKVKAAAKHWRKYQITMNKILKNLPPQNIFYLQYENLCINPQKWLNEITIFLDIDQTNLPNDLSSVENHIIGNRMRLNKPLTIKYNDKWKDILTQTEQYQVLRIAGDVNKSLNYKI